MIRCERGDGGAIHEEFVEPFVLYRALKDLQAREIEVQIQRNQIVLMAMTAGGARVQVGQTTQKKWRRYMQTRGRKLPTSVRRALVKTIGRGSRQALRRAATVPGFFVAPNLARAGLGDFCSPHRTPEGFKGFFNLPPSVQGEVFRSCPDFNCEFMNLHKTIEGL